MRVILFAIMGMLGAVSGVLLAARLGSGNAGAANGLEFDVIAAVVIGGTAMSGGRGSLVGTFLGVIFITLIGNGLVLLGVDSFLQSVVRGVIIVLAVLLNVTLSRRRGSNDEADMTTSTAPRPPTATRPAPPRPLPGTMQGVFLPGDGTAELREHAFPTPGPGQVLVQVGA